MPGQTGGQGTTPSSFGPAIGQFAWAQFPICSGYSGTEPYGGGPKPDINICIPQSNYPITALSQGTVTNLDYVSPWGYAVTIKDTNPHNPVATHDAYIHLTSIDPSLYVGKTVQAGDVIGTGGNNITGSGKQPAGVGYAWYNGDQYGYGPTWSQYVGSSQLNPTSFFTSFKAGTGNNTVPPGVVAAIQSQPGHSGSGCDTPVIGGLICWIQSQLATWALTVGFFLLGLVLIILGFLILIHPNPETVAKGAVLAA